LRYLPNILSAGRLLLALWLFGNPADLTVAILLIAAASDGLDGFIAKRFSCQTVVGTWLDPLADKAFAIAAVIALLQQQLLGEWELLALFSRDIALLLFTLRLYCQKKLHIWRVQSFYAGKLATTLQFLIFLLLVIEESPLKSGFYIASALLGVGAFIELSIRLHIAHKSSLR
jgi:phosphatidylglycerophosphate synthase